MAIPSKSEQPEASTGRRSASTSASTAAGSGCRRTRRPAGPGSRTPPGARSRRARTTIRPTRRSCGWPGPCCSTRPSSCASASAATSRRPRCATCRPLGPPMALLEVLESDRRLDPRARRVLMELYDLLASRLAGEVPPARLDGPARLGGPRNREPGCGRNRSRIWRSPALVLGLDQGRDGVGVERVETVETGAVDEASASSVAASRTASTRPAGRRPAGWPAGAARGSASTS